jgi:formate C-acetyltransferase
MAMTGRIESLKAHIHERLEAGVRRTVYNDLAAESLRRTVGEPRPIRRARAFAHLMDRVEQVVLPHELVAGSILGLWPLVDDADLPTREQRLEQARAAIRRQIEEERSKPGPEVARWALMARDHYDANIRFEDLQRLWQDLIEEFREEPRITPAGIYRVIEHLFVFDYGGEARRLMADLPWFSANHLHLKYERALRRGLGGMLRDVDARRRAAPPAKKDFYDAVEIVLRATGRFIARYARTLLEAAAAQEAADPARAAELRQMAGVCELVAEHAPRTFREAVQLVWMLHLVGNIAGGSAMSLGRLDQYLAPFYARDVEAGLLSREQAKDLLACVWLKVNEPKMRTVQSVCLGGVRPDGADGATALTDLCLDVTGAVLEPYPNTAIRVHAGTSEALWDRIARTVLRGGGQPQIFNDDAMIPSLVRSGVPEADAREYYPMGCIEVMLAGLQPTYAGAGGVDFPGLIEHVFHNGAPNRTGVSGAPTGELAAFRTFEDFLNAYLEQVRFQIRTRFEEKERVYVEADGRQYDPYASAFVEDCLDKGLDLCQGGARYPKIFVSNAMGLGTAVDSLAAVKAFVYDRRTLTLEQLRDILDRNFEDAESVRLMLARGAPAFGNDEDEADAIAERVFAAWSEAILTFPSRIGAIYLPQMFSYHSHVRAGEVHGASPNGRRRGETFSDGAGPSQGRDTRGPTCLLNSMTRLALPRLTGGCAFNMKISPDFVRDDAGRRRLAALLRAYIARGGMQIQVNLVDQSTLLDAQVNPERHRDIVVRVAGFCEYFTSLDRKVQDEIIARTAQR